MLYQLCSSWCNFTCSSVVCVQRHNGTRRQSHMEVQLLRENDCMCYIWLLFFSLCTIGAVLSKQLTVVCIDNVK